MSLPDREKLASHCSGENYIICVHYSVCLSQLRCSLEEAAWCVGDHQLPQLPPTNYHGYHQPITTAATSDCTPPSHALPYKARALFVVMSRLGAVFCLLLCWRCPGWALAKQLCPVLKASNVTVDDKTGCYLVVLHKQTNASTFAAVKSILLGLSTGSHVTGSVQSVVKVITVSLTEDNLNMVSYSTEEWTGLVWLE